MSAQEPLLHVRRLDFSYGGVRALREVNIVVARGGLVSLIGANGAGKSTLLRAISGLGRVRSGSVFFNGRDITQVPAHRRVRLGLSHVPEGRQIFSALTVADNLRLGAYVRERRDAEDAIEEMLSLFPLLKQKFGERAGGLSGGQQQMLAIARGLMSRPTLLLLDEPSMGLAPQMVEEVFKTIQSLNRRGVTILLVEQNAQAALSIADRAYVLESGHIHTEGPARSLLASEEIQRAYLGI